MAVGDPVRAEQAVVGVPQSGLYDGEQLPWTLTPLRGWTPRSSRTMSEPTTRSRTVLEVRISPVRLQPSLRPRCARRSRRRHRRAARPPRCAALPGSGHRCRPTGPEGSRAVDRTSGTVEGGQDPVTRCLDQMTVELLDPVGRSSCTSSTCRQRRSPSRLACWVELTMSVNSTEASTRVGSGRRRTPVRNS